MNQIDYMNDFYCQKVLPIVYDDSLSYYEVLCKLRKLVNDVINNQNVIIGWFEQLQSLLDTKIKEYTESQMSEWLNDGTLASLINKQLWDELQNQINEINSSLETIEKVYPLTVSNYEEMKKALLIGGAIIVRYGITIEIDQPLIIKSDTSIDFNSSKIKPSNNFVGDKLIYASNGNNIDLANGVFDGTNNVSNTLLVEGLTNSNIFKNEFCNATATNVRINGAVNVTIQNNKFHDSVKWGLYINTCNNVNILNNVSYNSISYDGFKIAGNIAGEVISDNSNITFSFNTAYNNGKDGFDYASNTGENIIITNNIIYNNALYGINVKTVYQGASVKNVTIQNNTLTNNKLGGIEIVDQQNDTTKKINLLNISNNNIVGAKTGSDLAEKGQIRIIKADGVTVSTNIISSFDVGIMTCGVDNINIVNNYINNTFRCVYVMDKIIMDWDGSVTQKILTSNNVNINNNTIYSDGQSGGYCVRVGVDSASVGLSNITINDNSLIAGNTNREQLTVNGSLTINHYGNSIGSGTTPPTFASRGTVFNNTDLTSNTLYWVNTSTVSNTPVWKKVMLTT